MVFDVLEIMAIADDKAAPIGLQIVLRVEDSKLCVWPWLMSRENIPQDYWADDLQGAYLNCLNRFFNE